MTETTFTPEGIIEEEPISEEESEDFNIDDLPELKEQIALSPKNFRLNMLAIEAKSGNRKAQEQLFDEFTPWIIHISKKYYVKGCDYGDIVQEARISCLRAITNYDPERKMLFSQYAQMVINGDLKNKLTYSHREIRDPERHGISEISLNEIYPTTGQPIDPPYFEIGYAEIEKETPEEAIDMIKFGAYSDFVNRLDMTDLEAKTILLIRAGTTYKEIAKQLLEDDSKNAIKTIDNARQRAVKKLLAYAANRDTISNN